MVLPAQKKKRRKSRWSSGVYAKKRYSSPHTSRDDAQLGSDEEEEDGDDEEEVEKGGGAEEEDQIVVDVETGPAPAQEGSVAKKQGSQQVILHETGKPENDNQTQNEKEKVDKAVTDQPGQSEENNMVLTQVGNENSETISVNTNKDSHSEIEGDIQGQYNTEESGETNSQKLTETETHKCQTVIEADDRNNKVVTVGEAEENSPGEAMEVEATGTPATDASAAVRGEEDTGTGLIATQHYLTLHSLKARLFNLKCRGNIKRNALSLAKESRCF